MKRTLKRGLKVREIAKREAIGLSMGSPLNLVPWVCNGARERAGSHRARPRFMKRPSTPYFWGEPVSIGSLALATEKLGNGRPSTDS